MRRHDDALLRIPLFSDFTTKELEHVHAVCTELEIPAGEVLIREGSIGHEMVVVIEGTLEVLRNGEHVADIHPNGFAGEMALLCDRRRNSTVVAKTDARVLHIDGRGFMTLLNDVPHLAVKMLPVVAERAASTHD